MAEAAPPVAVDQGAALFVAKGCVVCHVNGDVPQSESISSSIGPDLSQYSNDPVFLSRWLADPADVRPATSMPNLRLQADEIQALIVFLNGQGDS
jgi:cytochrome c2